MDTTNKENLSFLFLSDIVLFSQIHTKLTLPTMLRASLKTFSKEIFPLSETGPRAHPKFPYFLVLHLPLINRDFWQLFVSCINMHLSPFMGRQLTGCCTEAVCLLLNTEVQAPVGTKSVFTGFRPKHGQEESYRAHVSKIHMGVNVSSM